MTMSCYTYTSIVNDTKLVSLILSRLVLTRERQIWFVRMLIKERQSRTALLGKHAREQGNFIRPD